MKAVFFIGFFITLGVFAAKEFSKNENIVLKNQVATLTEERDYLQSEVTDLKAQVQTANARFEEMRMTYRETIPAGPVADLVTLVHKQIDQGMDPERLEQLISSAQSPRECTEPQTHRFVISTPAYTGPAGEVKLDEGTITVKGSGVSAQNAEGKAEAWFNPAKPVDMEIILSDGAVQKKSGVLPLTHALIFGDYEYRIKIEEGAKSFVKVTYDRCVKS